MRRLQTSGYPWLIVSTIPGLVRSGKVAMAIEAFARALRQIPTIIADNAGLDGTELVSQLRAAHHKGQHTMGLDIENGSVGDINELAVTESFQVKSKVLLSAAEAAEMILRVDEIIRSAPRFVLEHHLPALCVACPRGQLFVDSPHSSLVQAPRAGPTDAGDVSRLLQPCHKSNKNNKRLSLSSRKCLSLLHLARVWRSCSSSLLLLLLYFFLQGGIFLGCESTKRCVRWAVMAVGQEEAGKKEGHSTNRTRKPFGRPLVTLFAHLPSLETHAPALFR